MYCYARCNGGMSCSRFDRKLHLMSTDFVYQNLNGNAKDLQIHMKALAKMVEMRGGLGALGWDGVLHMFISW